MPAFAAASAKKLNIIAAVLLGVSVVSFFIGMTSLAIGIPAMVKAGGGGHAFFGGGDQPPEAGFRGGRPVGMYFMTRYWIATGSLEKSVWYFSPDGEAYENLLTGFSAEDLANHKGRHGKLSVSGDSMTITWSDGKEATSKLERDHDGSGDGFAWDTGLFAPVKAFDDPSELAGKWEGGESLVHGGDFIAASHSLDIHPDGTYSGESVASVKGTTEHSEIGGGSSSSAEGKWQLDGWSLILTHPDGTTTRGIAFPFDDEATPVKPDRFFFNGTMYKKE